MTYARICDRSNDGEYCQIQCEACGLPLDWVSNVELTVMFVRALRHFCFECDPGEADGVPDCLLVEGEEPDVYLIEMPNGDVEVRRL